MGKAVGIGGVFLHFEGEEKEVMEWYHKYLGFDLTPYGSGFTEGEQLVLLSFKRGNKPAPFLNIRVDNITEVIESMKKDDIEITSPITDYDYGKFAQIKDPFGNLIELWEPVVDVYKEMVKKEIEDYKKSKLD